MKRRAGHACFECGGIATVAHHVVPFSSGGTRTVALCQSHHDLAHGLEARTHDVGALVAAAFKKRRAAGLVHGRSPYGLTIREDNHGFKKDPRRYDALVGLLERRLSGWSSNALRNWLVATGAVTPIVGRAWSHWAVIRIISGWGIK